jgi:hypothetical protein
VLRVSDAGDRDDAVLWAAALAANGALGGASVNYVFIEHFQEIAQGHFTVCRLERVYGKEVVQAEYERLAAVTEPQTT